MLDGKYWANSENLKWIYMGFNVVFNTLYRSYHNGWIHGQRKPVHTVGQGSVL